MKNFVFHNPTKILFGTPTLSAIGPETAVFGKRALLVYGSGSVIRNGVLEKVRQSLAEQQVTVVEHGGVVSNPLLHHVRQGVELARAEAVEVVVAVGGGSVIDSAKAICAGAVVEHDVWKFFTGKKGFNAITPLPLTCVLTLAASASEMNGGMVVTNADTREKFGVASQKLNPRTSILDPTLTFTVPADYTAYGAVDAIAHGLEFYFTTSLAYTPIQDRLIEGLVESIMVSCEAVLGDPQNYDHRAILMWGATLALNGLSSAGLGKVGFPMHLIEHSLSALYNVPHGAGLSAVMPGWMQYQAAGNPEKFARFAERVFAVCHGSRGERAMAGIEALRQWFSRVGSPATLAQLAIPPEDIPAIAANCLGLARLWRMPEYTPEIIENILRRCY